jgi:L-iditol 2-dehydrogenase
MRQALIAAPGKVEMIEAGTPEPGPGEVRVAGAAVGICGSDVHALAGEHPWIDLPVVPGHEVAGTVDAIGDGVSDLSPGERVLLEANLVCRRCMYCISARYNLCESLEVVGCQTTGGMADAFVAPADRFHRVPEGMEMADAVLVEPLATVTHALRLVGGVDQASVAVLGAGSIGMLALLAARAAGASEIAVTDPVAHKRARALELGADLALDPRDDEVVVAVRAGLSRRPDIVFDCVASQGSFDQATALALKGGTIAVIGVPRHGIRFELPLLQDRELRVQGVAMYVGEDVERAIDLVRARRVRSADLVTATFPLADAPAAFDAARSAEHVKVVVTP